MFGLASKSKARRDFSRGKPTALIRRSERRRDRSSHSVISSSARKPGRSSGPSSPGRRCRRTRCGSRAAAAFGRRCRWRRRRPARSSLAGGAGSLCFSLTVVTVAGAAASEQLVIGGHRGQRPGVRRKVREPPFVQGRHRRRRLPGNQLTCRRDGFGLCLGGLAGLQSDRVRGHSPSPQSCGQAGDDVLVG
ncbi:hypothetical protein K8369_34845 [Streptomyces sp. PSKA30]|nr:hypothetical protein [Streptomyces sp. PSKA30]